MKRPFPDYIKEGDWTCEPGPGQVNIEDLLLNVPMGASPEEVAIRIHEYGHVKYSPESVDEQDKVSCLCIAALEDCRVNMILQQNPKLAEMIRPGMSKAAAEEVELIDSTNPITHLKNVLDYFGYEGYEGSERLRERLKLSPIDRTFIHELYEKLKVTSETDPEQGFHHTTTLARQLLDYVGYKTEEEKKKEEEEKKKEEAKAFAKAMKEKPKPGKMEKQLGKKVKKEREEWKEQKITLDNASKESDWGEMIIEDLATHGKRLIKRLKKRTDIGNIFRYPERWASDKRMFSKTKGTKNLTILVDCSGSMQFTEQDIFEIINFRNNATVACYDGEYIQGTLRIVAREGKVARTFPSMGQGNLIDFPALEWLAKHKGEKWWVSDGGVCGRGSFTEKYMAQCAQLVVDKKINTAPTHQEMIDYLKKGLVGRGKYYDKPKDGQYIAKVMQRIRKAKEGF